MKIIALTDIHGMAQAIDSLAKPLGEADLVLIAGDITNFGTAQDCAKIINAIKRFNENILAVPGNCDPCEIQHYLEGENISLHERAVEMNSLGFVGVGGSVPCPNRTPNEVGEKQLIAGLERAVAGLGSEKKLILLSHQPAYMTDVDIAHNSRHVGSQSIRDFIERYQPMLAVSGHIHESISTDTIGTTRLVNPGPLASGNYAWITITDKIEELEICRI